MCGPCSDFLFQLSIWTCVGELVDNPIDDLPVNHAPDLEFSSHASVSQRPQSLDYIPYPQAPRVFLRLYTDRHRLMDLILQSFMYSRPLPHRWRALLAAMLGKRIPVLQFAP